MPERPAPRHRWLEQLTSLPTTSGREHRVVAWVERWVGRRDDVELQADASGNLLLTLSGGPPHPPVVAAAHMDHPGFVADTVEGRSVVAVFRGGVREEYFPGARVEFIDRTDAVHPGRVDRRTDDRVEITLDRRAPVEPGDVGRWRFPSRSLGTRNGRLAAHACDDLAGAAAALAALDRARRRPDLRHFAVLLTRAEEEGFIGAIAAAKQKTLSRDARILSIEASRALPDAPIGGGPVVRVGDASTVFDAELTNRVAALARRAGLAHQRKLMDGGTCEATAFGAYGYRATGLCLPLGNYHNMGDLDGVEAGRAEARPAPEVISLSDFDGLVRLLVETAAALDAPGSTIAERLDERFTEGSDLLGPG